MSETNSASDSSALVETFSSDVHALVRASAGRRDRLRSFLQGHLPASVDVEVVLTPAVQTAAVLPADTDALVSSDATDLERRQATQLLEGIDAEFLVLITTAPAPLERVPLNDQLTADHAHQFGLAFHELLHILKTAIAPIAALLDAEVDPEYHRYVHELINIVEDGAIEHEAIRGANFSDTAEIRLELTRRIHSQTPDDLGDGQQVRLSFWDAVTTGLYDAAVYPTGTTEVLLDEGDDRVGFVSDGDEIAFGTVRDPLEQLAADALAIRGVDLDDATHTHDKTASVERARRVIDTWTSTLQPIVAGTVGPTDDSQGNEDTASGNDSHDCSPPQDDPAETPGEAGVSLDREATEDPYQDVFDHPTVTPDPDMDDANSSVSSPTSDLEEPTGDPASPPVEQKGSGQNHDDHLPGADGDSESGSEPAIKPGEELDDHPSRPQALAVAAERAREDRDDPGNGGNHSSPLGPQDGRADADKDETLAQTSLEAFQSGSAASEPSEEGPEDDGMGDPKQSSEDEPIDGRADDIDHEAADEPSPGPAHGGDEQVAPSPAEYEQALEHDREAAQREAAREQVDREAVERELQELNGVLDRQQRDSEQYSGDGPKSAAETHDAGGAGLAQRASATSCSPRSPMISSHLASGLPSRTAPPALRRSLRRNSRSNASREPGPV
ncbi:hypothetical protein [Salinigranum marinum]|uniref:hypothetical protein n=1 Tax=Salinigranum marinum TaxID=1515595 RepID=UPI002989A22A|nr:hypothetical protein [Salinigranum marinum]